MDQIGNILRPDTVAAIFLYILFFLGLVLLFVIPEKNETPQYLVFGMVFLVIVDFLRARSTDFPIPGSDNQGFFTFLIHIAIAIMPLIAGTMTRKQGRKGGAALPVGLLTFFIGATFAILSFIPVHVIGINVYRPF
jgi:hypothetical protein